MVQRSRIGAVLALATGCTLALGMAAAQAQQALPRVEVTGSNLKRTDTETASPIQVITRAQIERSGKSSIQEVLRGLTADNQGSLPLSFTTGLAPGAAAVSLRGLGVNSTLVLVNGRRMAPYGLADDGVRNFVDVSSLPLEAVERIEVLKDGASAVYGSDAIAGVVNIILRRHYTGASIGASTGRSGRGDGAQKRVFGSAGIGDLATDGYNVLVSVEASRERAIRTQDRGLLGAGDLRSIGFFDNRSGSPVVGGGGRFLSQTPFGVLRDDDNGGSRVFLTPCPEVNPLTAACVYDNNEFQQVQPDVERMSLFSRAALRLGPTATAYAEVGRFFTHTTGRTPASQVDDTGVMNPADPLLPVFHTTILPAAHPDNVLGQDTRMQLITRDLGPRILDDRNRVTRLVAGLQGTVHGWDYDTAIARITSRLDDRKLGHVRFSALAAALADGTYRINQPALVPQSVRDAISPALGRTATTSVDLVDAKGTRELLALPGGPLGLALGAEFRREKADTPPTPFTDTSDVVGIGFTAYRARRSVAALFGELNAPVSERIELTGALRHDHYSDYGRSTTPKFGIKFKPLDTLALRSTYARGFRAPSPSETGGSAGTIGPFSVLTAGNPDLRPERAASTTAGLVFEPVRGTSAAVDFFRIVRRNEIVSADPGAILNGVPDVGVPFSRVPGAQPNTFVAYGGDGLVGSVIGPYQNAARTRTYGFDVELRHRVAFGEAGRLSGQLFWTHVRSLERTRADGTIAEYAGTHGPVALSSGSGTPKDRLTLALTWERGPWTLTGTLNYVGPLKLVDHRSQALLDNPDGTFSPDDGTDSAFQTSGSESCSVFWPDGSTRGCRLPSFTTVDLFGKWAATRNLEVFVSIQNLFDRQAPIDTFLIFPYGINYNPAWHQAGAVGRFFTLGARYTF